MADMADAPGGGSLAFTAPSLQLSMRFGGKTAPAGIRARRPDWAGVFRTAVNPLRCAVPAPRKPWVTFPGHPGLAGRADRAADMDHGGPSMRLRVEATCTGVP